MKKALRSSKATGNFSVGSPSPSANSYKRPKNQRTNFEEKKPIAPPANEMVDEHDYYNENRQSV